MQNYANLTVIVPCFNSKYTIERAVNSILNQSLQPKEIILVNDASTDNTLLLLNQFAIKYPRLIKIINMDVNFGVSTARNKAWNIAEQPYIAFLDSDDAWHPKKIEIQYQFMLQNSNIDISGHEKLVLIHQDIADWELGPVNFEMISKLKLLLSNQFVTPSIMLKKDIIPRFEQTQRYMEDHFLWLQIIFQHHKVAKLNVPLVAIYKEMYGVSGLSSNLWQMEKAELGNYWKLYLQNHIKFPLVLILFIYSFVKYIRRLLIVKFRQSFVKFS